MDVPDDFIVVVVIYEITRIVIIVTVVHGDLRKTKESDGEEDSGILLRPLFFHLTGNLKALLSKFLWNFDRNSCLTLNSCEDTDRYYY
jgi:hypothetical protein